MPSFIKDVLPNAFSIQNSAGVVACSFARVSGEKKKKKMLGLDFGLHWPICIVGKVWKSKGSEVLRRDTGKGSPSCARSSALFYEPSRLSPLSSAPAPEMIPFQDSLALGEGLMLTGEHGTANTDCSAPGSRRSILRLGMASLQDAAGSFPTTAPWAPDPAAGG